MKRKLSYLVLFPMLLSGCVFSSNNFAKFKEKLGVSMPSKYERVFRASETTIDSNLKYDIYKINNDWKLEYAVQFQTDFEEDFDFEEYIDAINGYNPLNIPIQFYIPHSTSLDWVCKREGGSRRNYEWLLIFDNDTHLLYALDSTHQALHQAIPMNNYFYKNNANILNQ